jgi:hypothetical protein
MARPLKEGLDYFPMDVNLDQKIQALESVFKNSGFVWIVKFWQAAYRTNDGNVSLDGYHGVIHRENCRVTPEEHENILKFCLEIKLILKNDDGTYTSNGIKKRIETVNKERERWRKKHGIELSLEITPEEPRSNGGKERKGNKKKEENTNTPTPSLNGKTTEKLETQEKTKFHDFVFLRDSEFQSLCELRGRVETEEAILFLDQYLSNNEKKRKQYKDHNKVLQAWVFTAVKEKKLKEFKADTQNPKQKEVKIYKAEILTDEEKANPEEVKKLLEKTKQSLRGVN